MFLGNGIQNRPLNRFFTDRECRLIVDTGTSGIGIPYRYYQEILDLLTAGKSCVGVTCVGVREVRDRSSIDFFSNCPYNYMLFSLKSDFPVIIFELDPGREFPLLPSDYLLCSGNTVLTKK